jgi:nitronate monooxygenase
MSRMLSDILNIKYPLLMAPMFLVSNEDMMLAGLENGITAAFPAANYRTAGELSNAIKSLKSKTANAFGVNIIVNRSNPRLKEELNICISHKVDFIITSLGDPAQAIEACHKAGIFVFCDVTDMAYAHKVVQHGADAVIAVNRDAGGHPGCFEGDVFLNELLKSFDIPVIYAGGVSNGKKFREVMDIGAAGASVGTLFLATNESPVSKEYKDALVKYGSGDIVITKKISGTPLHVINTPYVKQIGMESNWMTRFLYRHKSFRRFLKKLAMKKGMKVLRQAAFSATYKTVWVAGHAVDDIKDIKPVKERIDNLVKGA